MYVVYLDIGYGFALFRADEGACDYYKHYTPSKATWFLVPNPPGDWEC